MNKLVYFLSFFILVISACKKDYEKIDKEKIDDYTASKNIVTKSTASGVQYVIEKEGVGENLIATDEIAVKYKGYFLDDAVFDKSDSAIFYLSGVIEGWKDGLQNFKEGSKGKIFVPSDLAYGKQGVTSSTGTKIIPARAVLAFDVEILRKNPIASKNRQDIKAFIKSKNWKADSTASGIFYVIDEAGTGNNPTSSSTVTVKYKGYTLDGKVFDQSDNSGATFSLNSVIEGWKQGIPLFKKGGKGKLLIPARLAYYNGTQNIPPYSPLVFEVELLNY